MVNMRQSSPPSSPNMPQSPRRSLLRGYITIASCDSNISAGDKRTAVGHSNQCGCPILRALAEGWDSTTCIPRVADIFALKRPTPLKVDKKHWGCPRLALFETWAFQLPVQKSGHEPSTPLMNGSEIRTRGASGLLRNFSKTTRSAAPPSFRCQRFATQGVLAESAHPP